MRRWGNAERLRVVQVCTQSSRAEARPFFCFPHGLPCFLPAPSLLSGVTKEVVVADNKKSAGVSESIIPHLSMQESRTGELFLKLRLSMFAITCLR